MADTRPHTSGSSASMQTLRQMSEETRSKAMRRLWARLGGIYGADRWERAYGATPSAAWLDALGERTLADVTRAVETAEADDSGRIPTLGQFRSWCRRYSPGTFAGAYAPMPVPDEPRSLPDLMSRTKTGRAWLALMRLDGVIPRGATTIAELDEALEGFDIATMREQHEDAYRATCSRLRIEPRPVGERRRRKGYLEAEADRLERRSAEE